MRFDMPSDAQRMDKVTFLASEGYEDRILLSHDIHTKHRLVSIKLIQALNNIELSKHNIFVDRIWWTWLRTYTQQCITKT